jgi:hypothetical protein
MPSELHPSRLKAARDPIDGVWGVLGIHLPVIATDTFSTFFRFVLAPLVDVLESDRGY